MEQHTTAAPLAETTTQIPLSVGQEAMWISWKLDPGQWTHIIPTPFRVTGTLDVGQLRRAIADVGEAHPQLRARVVQEPDGLRLCWSDAPPIPVTEHTVTGDMESEVRRTWQRPFDLRRGPLARVDVLNGPEGTVLLLAVHHLVFDGASILILLERLRRAYAGEPLEPAAHSEALAAVATRSRELADTPAGDAQRTHWRRALGDDLPVLDLPPSVDDPGYTVLDTLVPAPLAARLRAQARELGVSYLTVLLSSYFVLLHRYCDQDDLLASLPFHGRNAPQLRDVVGYFVNALPIRYRLREDDTYATVIHGVRAVLREATAHGDLPLPAILREVGLSGWQARTRTHGTVFQYWHAGLREGVDVQDLRLRSGGRECALSLLGMESSADYTLAVMVREDSGGTHALWKDPTGAVGPTLLRMLADDYIAVLEAVADDPNTPVRTFTEPVATPYGPVERRRVATLIGTHPAVRRCAVTPTAGGADVRVRLTTDGPVAEADVRALVHAQWGERMPRVRVEVAQDAAAAQDSGAAPKAAGGQEVTPALAAMVRVWEEVLGFEGIEPDDSFFELGGHSLLAESLVLAVSKSLGREVPIRDVFEYPRLREFAEHLGLHAASPANTEDTADGAPTADATGSSATHDTSFPAAGFQQRIWLAERVAPGTAAYNVPLVWRVPGAPLRVPTLARALQLLVTRHEILRTRFVERDGRLWQEVGEPWSPHLRDIDLRGLDDPQTALGEWLEQAADHPFDAAEGRLLTAAVLRTGDAEQVLFVCLHHLVWDGESEGIFLRELSDCYSEAERARETAGLTENGQDDGADEAIFSPASAHQDRIAFIDQFEKGTVYPTAPVYHNLSLCLRLDRAPEADRLQRAVDRVVAAHEALRTDLKVVEGRVSQRVHPRATVVPKWFDPVDEECGETPKALGEWSQEPFDLGQGPLLRVFAQPSTGGALWLALVSHQAVVDRAGLLIVAEDLLAALSDGQVAGTSYREWLAARPEEARLRDLDARAAALRAETEPLRLPERRLRAAVHVYREHTVPVPLPDDLPVAEFADRLGLERQDVLLAAFAALLAWYSGQEEMTLGVNHHGRQADGRRVVGPLANLLPLRLRPTAQTTFEELATHVAAELTAAWQHDQAQFDELVLRLNPARDMSRTALFDVLFTCVDGPARLTAPDGTRAAVVETGSGHGKYDLHLFLRPDVPEAPGQLLFNGLYFDDAQMQLMAEHYVRMLRALLTAACRPVGEVEPLTDRERHTQLMVWNATDAGYPHTTLHALVSEQAEQRPNAVALTDATDGDGGTRDLTYRQLLGDAQQLARGLVARGVRPGERVALLLPRGATQVTAILAVLLAGGVYLPLDPAIPAERKEFILADSGTRWAVVPDETVDAVAAAFTGEAVTPALLRDAAVDEAELPSTAPEAPAYCIYTSGTTGHPKGVDISHRNAVRLLTNDRFPFSFGPQDVWTLFHSYAFDFSVWELFCGLAHGGRVVLVSEDDARDPDRFWRLLRRERVTVLNQTPSAFRQLLAAEQRDPAPLDHLRYVIFGGEALQPILLAPWLDSHPHVRLVNMYGITETTVHVTARTITRADTDGGSSVIGTPIPTTTVHLMDPRTGQRLLPVGVVGEMYIGGAGVAAGYLNRPELDAERFVPNPFAPGRLFRSGDLARYRPDGTLEFLGRADAQIQLRGYRIEPGEIEARLRDHPAVADAAVLLEDERLVGYVLPRHEPPSAGDLRSHLQAALPEYMVPGALRTVDALRLTTNGKLDPHALRSAAVTLEVSEGGLPVSATAQAICGLWQELLDVARVGPDDSFFALGGHSMLAVRMLGRVRDRFGTTVPLRALFERPRLQEFADLVDTTVATTAPEPARLAPPEAVTAASAFQERIWLAERYAQDTAYNVPLAWRTQEPVDREVLRKALNLLIARHEILRTAFTEHDGRLRQRVAAPWAPRWDHLDLRGTADADREIRAWLDHQAAQPFDPASGRMLRPALADLGEGGHALLLCLHHLVIDGESIPALLHDLHRCYLAVRDGGEPPASPTQYREVVAEQEAERGSARRRADLAHWEEHLAGAPVYTPLPAPAVPQPHGAIPLALPADLAARLHPVQQEHGVSWFMIAASALAAVMYRTTGSRDITFSVPASTRDRGRFAEVIGPCLNSVVLRSRPAPDATVRDLLHTMRAEVLGAFEHHAASFEEVVERLRPPRAPGRTPYADVTLNMTLLTGRTAPLGDATLTPFLAQPIGERETKFALTISLVEQDGHLSGAVSYRGDLVEPETARRIADAVARLLTDLPNALALPLDHLGRDIPAADVPAELPAQLPAGSIARAQYRDVVAAQEAERGSARRAADLAYWQEHLAGAPEHMEFSAPAVPEPNGSVPVPLPADLLERLRPVLSAHVFTPYQLAAGALAALLHRWTGRDDVVFATPATHRDQPGFPDVLGPCLNTVVLRSRPAPDATMLDLLQAMRADILDSFEHHGAPFEEVVERLNPTRRPGRTPYADVTLSMETGPADPPRLADSPLVRLPLAGHGAGYLGKFDLTVVLSLRGTTLSAAVSYRGDRHRRADVEQLAALYGRLLTRLPDSLEARLGALDLVGDDTPRLRAWESGGEPEPSTTVPELIAHWVRQTPHAPAVATADGTLGYRELHERACRLAVLIRPHVRGEDPVVALLLPRGGQFVLAMLAAWYAGAAFCPIEPTAPAARVDAVLADLGACAVLTNDSQHAARLTAAGTTVLTVTDPRAATSTETVPEPVDPRATAYVIYTSGTTGEPKGVVIRHHSLAQLVLWGRESFALGPGDRVGNLLSTAFDATQWDVWSALASGACVVPHEGPVTAPALPGWLDVNRVSVVLLATPLAETVWAVDPPLRHLRWMLVGGAALTRLPPPGTAYRVRNAYGPTESTVMVLTREIDASSQGPLNTLGGPIAGTRVQILDGDGRRCPVGVVGEICLSGAGVAAGYWRRPELTGECFRGTGPDGEPQTTYRTGDQGRRLPDGTVEYLGRLDRQLKIRGYRIEPSEIETALLRQPEVSAAVVHGDPHRAPHLTAYLVPGEDCRPTTAELLQRLRSRLLSHLVPEAVVWLDELPLTPSGKVDIARLPRPSREHLPVAAVRVAPSDETERVIAAVWAEVLGLAQVGIHDNFFDLGGNSLTLATLHARLVERLSVQLPLVVLFEHPTVAALARSLRTPQTPPAAGDDTLRQRAARSHQAAARQATAARARPGHPGTADEGDA